MVLAAALLSLRRYHNSFHCAEAQQKPQALETGVNNISSEAKTGRRLSMIYLLRTHDIWRVADTSLGDTASCSRRMRRSIDGEPFLKKDLQLVVAVS